MTDRFANPDVLFRVGVRARTGLPRLPDDLLGEVIIEETPVGPTPEEYYETRGPDPIFEEEVRRKRVEREERARIPGYHRKDEERF